MTFLGIDPGTHEIGWAFVNEKEIIDANLIISKDGQPFYMKFLDLYEVLEKVMERARALDTALVVINGYAYRSARLEYIRGLIAIVRLVAYRSKLPIQLVPPHYVHKAVTGREYARKDVVREAICRKYPASHVRVPEHAMNAVALAMTGFELLRRDEAKVARAIKLVEKSDGCVNRDMLRGFCTQAEANRILRLLKQRYHYTLVKRRHVFEVPLVEKGLRSL